MKKIAIILLILGSMATVSAAFAQGRESYSGDANGLHIIKGKLKVARPGYGMKNTATGVGTDSTTGVDSAKFVPADRKIVLNGTPYPLSGTVFINYGSVSSVGIAIGTSGTNVNVSGSPVTGSGTVTINIPNASASNRGALTSTDWSTFNNKIGGSGSTNTIPVFSGTNTLTSSSLATDFTNYAMGGAVNATYRLSVFGRQYVNSGTTYGNGVAIDNASNSGINISTNNGTGMDVNIPAGGYTVNFKEGGTSVLLVGNYSVLVGSNTDRGTGKLQITGNVSVTGANSSNTYRWDAAAGATPSNTATPAGWLYVNVAGNSRFIPYYQ